MSLLGNPSHDNRPRAWWSTYRRPWPIPFGHPLGRGRGYSGGVVVVGVCLLVQATCDVDALPRAKADSYSLCCSLCSNWNTCEIGVPLCRSSRKSPGAQEDMSAGLGLRAWSRCRCKDVNTSAYRIQLSFQTSTSFMTSKTCRPIYF